jgi:predicted alpha/beta superfamily hydrolase
MRSILFAAAILAAIVVDPARADTINSQDRTQQYTLKSSALNEQREIYIRTPPNYDGKTPLPVIYVVDAEWNFELIAAHFDFMIDNGGYPPVIVTGVRNVNRNRDFLPRADTDYEDSGGADAFLDFVSNEWAPYVEKKFSVSDDRVLIGHSFGGVFALHALFSKPDLFNAYIALSPSSWVADRILFDEADAFFAAHPDFRGFAYIAVGEGDGGPTTPSTRELMEKFKFAAPAGLEWQFSITPKADHFRNFTAGLNGGLSALFPAWGLDTDVRQAGEQNGADGVNRWFDKMEADLGFRFFPSWFDFGIVGIRLSTSGQPDAAIAVIERTRNYHPENANFAALAAQTYENAGELDKGVGEYQRAIQIAKRDRLHPNTIHLDRLNAGIERIRRKMDATKD